MTSLALCSSKPVLHVVVIGFHHKKGCQVEYAYPPLLPGGQVHSNEAPAEWKHLPSLAIPDGAHNYLSDSIYFHLPAIEGINRTVYGVACYRQIEATQLKIKTDDITRSTVQKSVCVLSYLPLYGLIEAKLELITHAYFQELDFSQVSLLEETYNSLNASLTESLLDGGSQVYLGMNVKDLVQAFRHKIVLLFKLILLERRVLFTGTPVEKLGRSILSILSLYPGMIEHGLVECTSYGIHRHISPTLASTKLGSESDADDFMEIRYSEENKPILNMFPETEVVDTLEPASPTMDRGIDQPTFPDHAPTTRPHQPVKRALSSSSQGDGNTYTNSSNNALNRKLKIHKSGKLKGNKTASDSSISVDSNSSLQGLNTPNPEDRFSISEGSLELVDDYYKKDADNGKDRLTNTHCDIDTKATGDGKVGRDSSSNAISSDGDARRDASSGHFKKSWGGDEIPHQQVVLTEDSSILTGVTAYEAVQAGKIIPKKESVINIEELSEQSLQLEEDYYALVQKENHKDTSEVKVKARSSKNDLEGDEKVEELDSPESISQIDQEDCFSWEEDNLSLTINTEKPQLDMSAGLASSFKDPPVLERYMSTGSQHSHGSQKGQDGDQEGSGEGVEGKEGTDGETKTVETSTTTHSGNNGLSPGVKAAAIRSKLSNAFSGLNLKNRLSRNKQGSRETSEPASPVVPELPPLPVLQQDDMGFPLAIFTKGCVCFPYLSLQYYDLLNDVNVRSFVIGATNMLFRQKRHLTDVVVDVCENKLEIHDRELQKLLTLTTADLRFADILVKAVSGVTDDGYFDGTEWEGNDEWLRAQFKAYLEGMLAAVTTDDPKLVEDFGVSFIQCWKTTHNYKVWSTCDKPRLQSVQAGHPCQGHLSVADIKVRFSHTMHNTEGGKKINAAVSSTGKYVVQTGKAVGGALTQAKSSLSSWFSTWKSSNTSTEMTDMTKQPEKNSPDKKSSPDKKTSPEKWQGKLVAKTTEKASDTPKDSDKNCDINQEESTQVESDTQEASNSTQEKNGTH